MLPLILILAAILLFWVVASLRSNGGTKDLPRDSTADAAFLASFSASTSYDDPPRHDSHHSAASDSSPAPDHSSHDSGAHHSGDTGGSFDSGSWSLRSTAAEPQSVNVGLGSSSHGGA